MKRVFGTVEAVFDILYLIIASALGFILLFSDPSNSPRMIAGIMALVLAGGDAFHLVPRIIVIKTGGEEKLLKLLGRGKQITSVTMTLFYVFLWRLGLQIYTQENNYFWSIIVYMLAGVRIILCFFPQNKWTQRYPPVMWGIYRNIPFFLLGMMVTVLFYIFRFSVQGLAMMWLAIVLSFTFYLPVVLWANINPKFGMLMLPKTCTYTWLLVMCLSI